jgi:hypothetical protein
MFDGGAQMFPQQPAQHHAPQPVPSATDLTGHGPPTGGFPVIVTAGYPPPRPPAARGRVAFLVLVLTAAALAAAIAVTAVLGWSDVSDMRRDVAGRQAELDRIAQQEQAASRKQLDDFRGAGLDSLLQKVKDLDKAADVAFRGWRDGTARFGVLDGAMNDCDDAVIAYNTAAAVFPDHLFTALPKRINLDNPETDCGRAFTGNI